MSGTFTDWMCSGCGRHYSLTVRACGWCASAQTGTISGNSTEFSQGQETLRAELARERERQERLKDALQTVVSHCIDFDPDAVDAGIVNAIEIVALSTLRREFGEKAASALPPAEPEPTKEGEGE